MRLIAVDKVHFGHALHGDIFSAAGQCLFKAGTKLESAVIERLTAMGYRTLVIADSLDAGIDPKPLISEGLRLSAVKLMSNTFQMLHGKADPTTAPALSMKEIFDVCNAIVDEVALGERGRVVDVPTAKPMDEYAAEHAVAVAVLSAFVGGRLGYNLMHLRDLVVGGILHNIGEAFLPNDIVNKKTKYTSVDSMKMQQHGVLGFRYLTRFSEVKATSRAVSIQHHERVSGKGYPKGLTGPQIHQYSGVVGACDIFDAMISDRPYRPRQPAIVALGVLMSSKEALFAPDLRDIFSQLFCPFPIGTWVTLSDGRHGIVKSVPKESLTRPDVKVVYDAVGQSVPAVTIQLGQNPNLRIAGIPGEF
jgi:HD-GYP domain-containing protein (c-di-GMP phosphodiesterase class II)